LVKIINSESGVRVTDMLNYTKAVNALLDEPRNDTINPKTQTFIDNTAEVLTNKIHIKQSSIADNTHVASNSTIVDSIIGSHAKILENSKISNSIVFPNVTIPKSCQIKDCVILPDTVISAEDSTVYEGEIIGVI
jgi:ADP-glucose pyrophosphorylase